MGSKAKIPVQNNDATNTNNDVANINNKLVGDDVLFGNELTIMLLDISSSMLDEMSYDVDENGRYIELSDLEDISELEADERKYHDSISGLKVCVSDYVKQRDEEVKNGSADRLGIITFESEVDLLWSPSRTDYDNLLKKIDSLYARRYTNMSDAITLGMQIFSRYTDGLFRMIVVSDGEPDHRSKSLAEVERAYEEYGIIVDTIAIGKNCDVMFMRALAEKGGGECTEIRTYKAMLETFKRLESERHLLLGGGIKLLGTGDETK